jgi:hypothetical protein
MGISNWIAQNWFAVVQTGAMTGGLLLAACALWLDARARRVSNLIRLTEQHRDLWERMFVQPELARILDPAANLAKSPVTAQEEQFVIFIILHLSNTYYATQAGFFQRPSGLGKDIEQFFSLPIPRTVWERVKDLQEQPFVTFVETYRQEPVPHREDEFV